MALDGVGRRRGRQRLSASATRRTDSSRHRQVMGCECQIRRALAMHRSTRRRLYTGRPWREARSPADTHRILSTLLISHSTDHCPHHVQQFVTGSCSEKAPSPNRRFRSTPRRAHKHRPRSTCRAFNYNKETHVLLLHEIFINWS